MKPFPIPVSALGPGSQQSEENLDYMVMPSGMAIYVAPILPEPEDMAACVEARKAIAWLNQVLQQYKADATGVYGYDLVGMDAANMTLLNQILGEGEVSALVSGDVVCRIQESIFAGVWRILLEQDGVVIRDAIEVCPIPPMLMETNKDGHVEMQIPSTFAPGVINAPSVLAEIAAHLKTYQAGDRAHIINLTLLPWSPDDNQCLEEVLGPEDITILSRGYGNCRITSTRVPNVWHVRFYNSQDVMILDTVEITSIPEVALAAREDFEDSGERVAEVLGWMEQEA